MEGREGITSGVTVIGAEAPSNYHVAPRNENPSLSAGSVSVAEAEAPINLGSGGTEMGKKKRGRPRKYGPDGTVSMAIVPFSVSSSVLPGDTSATKKGKGRPLGSENRLQNRLDSENLDELVACASGARFMPHIITVNAGEDVTMKIISFSQQGPRAICILSANGAISNVTLHQPDSSGGTLTYEGRFEILSLSGSFMPSESGGTRSRAGGLSVSLASPDGRVVGGGVAGLLVAASPVQVVVGSFLPKDQQEQKPKKPKTVTRQPTTAFPPSPDGSPMAKPEPAPSSSFQRESWATMHSSQELRKSATDINISLPGG